MSGFNSRLILATQRGRNRLPSTDQGISLGDNAVAKGYRDSSWMVAPRKLHLVNLSSVQRSKKKILPRHTKVRFKSLNKFTWDWIVSNMGHGKSCTLVS